MTHEPGGEGRNRPLRREAGQQFLAPTRVAAAGLIALTALLLLGALDAMLWRYGAERQRLRARLCTQSQELQRLRGEVEKLRAERSYWNAALPFAPRGDVILESVVLSRPAPADLLTLP